MFVPVRAAAAGGVSVTLIYNSLARSLPAEERDRAAAGLLKFGIHLLSADNIHGKFMTWDEDALLITSFNWLATTPDPWKPLGAENRNHRKGSRLSRNAPGNGSAIWPGSNCRPQIFIAWHRIERLSLDFPLTFQPTSCTTRRELGPAPLRSVRRTSRTAT